MHTHTRIPPRPNPIPARSQCLQDTIASHVKSEYRDKVKEAFGPGDAGFGSDLQPPRTPLITSQHAGFYSTDMPTNKDTSTTYGRDSPENSRHQAHIAHKVGLVSNCDTNSATVKQKTGEQVVPVSRAAGQTQPAPAPRASTESRRSATPGGRARGGLAEGNIVTGRADGRMVVAASGGKQHGRG